MAKKKVYLPKWQRWFLIPMMLVIWGLITYLEFFNDSTGEELGLLGYVLLSALFLGLGVMFWVMTSGKLPAYIIEENDNDQEN